MAGHHGHQSRIPFSSKQTTAVIPKVNAKAPPAARKHPQNPPNRAVACRKYLYDFGTPDRLGEYLLEGIKFPFTPVKAADTWDEARGYGFNKPAMSDENRQWVRSKLDGDGCRLSEVTQFRRRQRKGVRLSAQTGCKGVRL